MQILLVSATEFEINEFLSAGLNQLDKDIGVDVLITGIGAPVAVYHITKAIVQNKYDLVIQAGIAGSFDKSYKRGDVVLIKNDRFADIGIYEKQNFISIFETQLANSNSFPYTDGALNNNTNLKKYNLPVIDAITINTITDSKKLIKQMKKKFSPQAESMEGAALHYVCLQNGIDFLQIRAISNYVGERDKKKWETKKAISNLNKELIRILKNIK
ncbi:hypothetical protein BH09BAC2_BH09BAC2_09570 [soil metagenome]